jgi:hypothetical protein
MKKLTDEMIEAEADNHEYRRTFKEGANFARNHYESQECKHNYVRSFRFPSFIVCNTCRVFHPIDELPKKDQKKYLKQLI